MIFFSNLDGTLLPIPSQVNQNSFDANKIYLIAPYNTGYSVDATFILPDGTITTPYIMSISVDLPLNIGEQAYYVRELSINKVITQFYGNATIQFSFYSGGKKLSTQAGAFTINRGVANIVDSVDFSEELYNTIMNALSSVLTAIDNTVTPYGCCSVFEIIPNGEVTIHTTFNAIDWGDGTFSYTNNKHTYENQNAKIVRLYTGSAIRGGTLLFSNASVNIAKFGFGVSLINTRINDLNITEIHFPETLRTITGELCTAPQLDKLVFKGNLPFSSYLVTFGNTTPSLVIVPDDTATSYINAGTPNVRIRLNLIEPSARQTDFVTVVKDVDGYRQENMPATYTPRTSYNAFVGVLRGLNGQIKGQTPPLASQTDLDLINRGELNSILASAGGKVYKHIVSFRVYDYTFIACSFIVYSSQATPFTAETLPNGAYVGWSGDGYNLLISNDNGVMFATKLYGAVQTEQYLLGDDLYIDSDIVTEL